MEKTENINEGIPYLFAEETLYGTEDSDEKNILFEGGNKKGILLLYENSLSEKISGTEKEIMNRMLAGLKSSMEDITLVNVSFAGNISYLQLMKELQFRFLVSFDVAPEKIFLNIEAVKYKTFQFGNCQLLFCDPLVVIDKNKNIKLKFWEQFSPFFSSSK
jgi:hypothetical protein